MISRGLRKTKIFYNCCFVQCGHLNQNGDEVTCHGPLNLSKDGCQSCGCFHPDEVVSQDEDKPHSLLF